MREDPKRLIDRYTKATEQKDLFRDLYDKAYNIYIPQRNLYNNPSPGQRKTFNVFTSTGVVAVNRFVNHMQASLTPPFKKWVELSAGPAIPDELKNQVNDTLELITETGFELINSSNFNVAVSEFYYDLAIGTAVLLTLPGQDEEVPINFVAVPIEQISIEEGPYGTVNAVFRCHKMAGVLLKETWPDAKIPSDVERSIRSKPLGEISVIEVSYKSKGKHYYDVMLEKSKERIVQRQFPHNRWIVTRIGKVAGEVYGRGPAIQALDDMLMLNKIKELGIKSAQLNAFGIYTCSDADVVNTNTVNFTPGSIITVRANGGTNGPSLMPLPRSGDVNWQQLMAQEMQSDIKDILLNDKLPPEIGPVRSATEIAERQKSGRIDTESYFGRLMYEFVQPVWQNVISIMDEKGLIELPPELKKIDNYLIKIKVLSPIAKEQGFQDVQNVVQAYQIIQQAGGPEAATLAYKTEDLGEWVGDKLGVPSSLIRSPDERKKMQQMYAEVQAAQQQQPMMG